jgi:hypothetical protein
MEEREFVRLSLLGGRGGYSAARGACAGDMVHRIS